MKSCFVKKMVLEFMTALFFVTVFLLHKSNAQGNLVDFFIFEISIKNKNLYIASKSLCFGVFVAYFWDSIKLLFKYFKSIEVEK